MSTNMATKSAIWKFPIKPDWLNFEGKFQIDMPKDATVLTVQAQRQFNGLEGGVEYTPMIWALVNPDAPATRRTFLCVGTGHEVPPGDLAYIGTVQLRSDALVLHFFEDLVGAPSLARAPLL